MSNGVLTYLPSYTIILLQVERTVKFDMRLMPCRTKKLTSEIIFDYVSAIDNLYNGTYPIQYPTHIFPRIPV